MYANNSGLRKSKFRCPRSDFLSAVSLVSFPQPRRLPVLIPCDSNEEITVPRPQTSSSSLSSKAREGNKTKADSTMNSFPAMRPLLASCLPPSHLIQLQNLLGLLWKNMKHFKPVSVQKGPEPPPSSSKLKTVGSPFIYSFVPSFQTS